MNLQKERKNKGISLKELSLETGIAQERLVSIENNLEDPTSLELENICHVLKLNYSKNSISTSQDKYRSIEDRHSSNSSLEDSINKVQNSFSDSTKQEKFEDLNIHRKQIRIFSIIFSIIFVISFILFIVLF